MEPDRVSPSDELKAPIAPDCTGEDITLKALANLAALKSSAQTEADKTIATSLTG